MHKENKPRHEQISDWLRRKIQEGDYDEGDQLPSESELREQFEVSRVTVRHALKTLENEGLIYRRQGLGSFVDDFEIEQSMVCLTDFSEDMKRAGLTALSKVADKKVIAPSPEIAGRLNTDSDAKVLQLDRLRLGNGSPIAFDITWLPLFYGQLLEGEDLQEKTIYQILEKRHEIPILRGEYNITAANADSYLAEHLGVDKKQALMLIERTSMSTGGKVIYFQKRYYRPDRIRYEVELERRDTEDCDYRRGLPLKKFVPVFTDR